MHHLECIDSTNCEARRTILAGAMVDKHVIIADMQTSGRGRQKREWFSDEGNLFVSFCHQVTSLNESVNGYSLAAGLAVRDTIAHYLPSNTIQWKWPNDVLVEGKKASGILLEHVHHANKDWLITGVGINIKNKPESETLWPTTSLESHTDTRLEKLELLKTFVKFLDSYYKRVSANEIDMLIEACLTHAARLGEIIQVRLPTHTLEGVFETIDSQGNLLLTIDGKTQPVSAGDIFFKE